MRKLRADRRLISVCELLLCQALLYHGRLQLRGRRRIVGDSKYKSFHDLVIFFISQYIVPVVASKFQAGLTPD